MIEIILDNNALQYICDPLRYKSILERINYLHDNKLIRLHFNKIIFVEQIIGLNRKHFGDAQRYIRNASKIFHKSLLLQPKKHIEDCIFSLSNAKKLKANHILRSLIQEFCIYKSFDDVSNNIGNFRDYYKQRKDKIFLDNMDIYNNTKSRKMNNEELEIWRELLKSYGLLQKTKYIPGYKLENRLVSLIYLRDLIVYHRKKMLEGIKPRPSDDADYNQVVYLNICDYIITKDRNFIDKLNNCGNNDLKDRGIETEEFIKILFQNRTDLEKRAPHTCSQIPVEKPNKC